MRDAIYALILTFFTILIGILTVYYWNANVVGPGDVYHNVQMESSR